MKWYREKIVKRMSEWECEEDSIDDRAVGVRRREATKADAKKKAHSRETEYSVPRLRAFLIRFREEVA
jgi:hypothetical protein